MSDANGPVPRRTDDGRIDRRDSSGGSRFPASLGAAVAVAGLAQAAVLWVVTGPARSDLILLLVLEIIAGSLVAQIGGGWPGAMAGALIGGTVVATANTSLTGGQLGWGILVAVLAALLLFTPGYLLGQAYRAAREPPASGMTPMARITLAGVVLAVDIAIAVWVLATFRLPGP